MRALTFVPEQIFPVAGHVYPGPVGAVQALRASGAPSFTQRRVGILLMLADCSSCEAFHD